MCPNTHEVEVSEAEGWIGQENSDFTGDFFCPDHLKVSEWMNDQCSGCVAGWGECSLWRGFASCILETPLTKSEMDIIRSGKCPRRTNRTFSFSSKGIERLDMSSPSNEGEAFYRAITEWWDRYGAKYPNGVPEWYKSTNH